MARNDLDVGRLSFGAAHHLVDHDFGVGEAEALAFLAGGEDDSRSGCCDTDAYRRNGRLDVVHGVVHRHCRGDGAAGGVDVELNVFFRIFVREEEELRDDDVRTVVVDRSIEEDDAIAKEARVDVVRSLAELGFFYNGWDENAHK